MNKNLLRRLNNLHGENGVIVKQDANNKNDCATWRGKLNTRFGGGAAEVKASPTNRATFDLRDVIGVDVKQKIVRTKIR